MTTHYNTWKEQQDNSIYKETWRPHAPVILMMLLDRIKEKHILSYLRDELGLKKPKKSRKFSLQPPRKSSLKMAEKIYLPAFTHGLTAIQRLCEYT